MILPGQISSHKIRDRKPDKTLIEKGTATKAVWLMSVTWISLLYADVV
jgi:hypothetical protein